MVNGTSVLPELPVAGDTIVMRFDDHETICSVTQTAGVAVCITLAADESLPGQVDVVWRDSGRLRRARSVVLETGPEQAWIELGRPVDVAGRTISRRTAATLVATVTTSDAVFQADLRDIAAGGVGLHSDQPVSVGERISISVASESGATLSVDADVVHVRQTPTGFVLGCAFPRLVDISRF